MNFQFSGSIPSIHWQNNGPAAISSQPITEFTILNGKVTLTRAGNDTRNDVNVTIVANGRRNENPLKRRISSQPVKEFRWRNRRRQDIQTVLSNVRDLKNDVNEKTEEVTAARNKFRDLLVELNGLKSEVHKKKLSACKASHELAKAVNDLKNPELYNFSKDEANLLRFSLVTATDDLLEAKRSIEDVETDLINEADTNNSEMPKQHAHMDCLLQKGSDKLDVKTNCVRSFDDLISRNPSKCSVCWEKNINSVLYKCGHMCTCFECAVKLQQSSGFKKCPVCRSVIIDIIKIFSA